MGMADDLRGAAWPERVWRVGEWREGIVRTGVFMAVWGGADESGG
jgi:hypothetical protein